MCTMPENESDLSRRDFLKYAAATTATTAAWYSTALKTDAMANQPRTTALPPGGEVVHSYMYTDDGP